MATDNPFFLTKIECPVCKTINEFETVRVGAYTEGERDTDFCPRDITWRRSKYQAYDPLVFFTTTCSNCFYTREFTNKFKDWKNDNTYLTYRLKGIKAKHLEKLATADSSIRTLGENIDLHKYPSESAIIKLHLAVIDESFNDHFSPLDMGRFYIRIGWVYRTMDSAVDPNADFANTLMTDLDNRFESVRNSLANFEENVIGFQGHVMNHLDSTNVSDELRQKMSQNRDALKGQLERFRESVEQSKEIASAMGQAIAEFRSDDAGIDLDHGASFGGCRSFTEFMVNIKKNTNAIVINEREALEKAIHNYKDAFTNGKDIAAGNQQIQASYLIAELSRRVGDHDGAKQYFNSTIRMGQEFVYQNRRDQSRTALARKILELAIEQGRTNLAQQKKA